MKITVEMLRELLDYDPETGVLRWKERNLTWFKSPVFGVHWNKRWAGKEVGTPNRHRGGHLVFHLLCKLQLAHRVAWVIHCGEWPVGVIDHIDGNPGNNRIDNLRDVPQSVNCENQKTPSNKTGLPLGVFPASSKINPFFARIIVNKKRVYLGVFPTPEQAHEAYLTAKRRLHDGCTI